MNKEAEILINEKAIGKRQVDFVVKRLKGAVINQVQGRYGIPYDDLFWDRPIGHATPRNLLEEQVIQLLVRHRVCEALLEAHGLLVYRDFEHFEALFEKVNQSRARAVAGGEVIYGPVQYSRWDYYQYLMSNSILKLKNQLVEGSRYKISDGTLQAFADAKPHLLGCEPDVFETQRLYITYVTPEGYIHQEKQEEGKQMMEEAYLRLRQGDTPEDLVRIRPELLVLEKRTFGGAHHRTDLMNYSMVMHALKQMNEGSHTPVIQSNGAYQIVFLSRKREGERQSFEKARDFLLGRYMEVQIEERLTKQIASAQVVRLKPLMIER